LNFILLSPILLINGRCLSRDDSGMDCNWLRVLPMPLTSCRIWSNVILSYTAISFT
jgi:hypothetical protein